MFNRHKFPIQIFLIFENINIYYWTCSSLKPNHSLTLLPAEIILGLFKFIKSELILSNSFLIDGSNIDTSKYSTINLNFEFFLTKNKNLLFYIIYFYSISYKITFFFCINNYLSSVEGIYQNANWIERELIEMYGINIYNKLDSRNLLLDYTTVDNPMLKNYPCVGLTEVFYNQLEDCISYYPNTSVQL